MSGEIFLDTNVLVYLLSADSVKADRAESLVRVGAIISVQVLNEFAAVALHKLKLSWEEIAEVLGAVQSTCQVEALTVEGHVRGRQLAERYGFCVYDATIVASACSQAGCERRQAEASSTGIFLSAATRRDV